VRSTSRSTPPSDRTLPQGLLYWRVQAVDPAGNHLTWSPVRSFSNDQAPVSLAAAGGQTRPYSSDGRFFVASSSVTLKAPAGGTYQRNNGLYFTWAAAPLAAAYRLDVRDANGYLFYSVTTAATALARPSSTTAPTSGGAPHWIRAVVRSR
jgi:hypothetical protein